MTDKQFSTPNNIPVEFEQVSTILDGRFTKVKIWIAHEGENRNNSIFTKEVLQSMIPSLSNVPVLGYIKIDEDGEEDFKGHEERLVVEDGKFKLKYVGHAWGMIPETNNARFENRYGEDGVEREYLVCDGLLWNKFQDVINIFDRDSGYKSQSMELEPSSVKGYVNDNGAFVFTEAKVEGACILGEDVTPAMISSTIEKFSVSDVKSDLKEMLNEFNAHFSANKEKGDDTVPTNEENNEVVENTEFEEQTQETPVVEETPAENFEEQPQVEETPVENFEENPVVEDETPSENFEETPSNEETPSENFEEETPNEVETPAVGDKFTVKFELSHDDIRTGLYNALHESETFKEGYSYIVSVFDSHAVIEYEDYSNNSYSQKFFKVNYVKHENAVSLGDHVELFPMFLTADEKAQVDASRNNFTVLEEEVKGLREFKANIELGEKEQKLAQYSSVLSEEEFNSIKENLGKFSMVDIEKEIGFMLLKKNNFSANTQEETTQTRVGATNTTDSNPYGSASVYFSK